MKLTNYLSFAMLGTFSIFGITDMVAEHVTPQQSLERALNSEVFMQKVPSSAKQCVLAHTESTAEGIETVYIFSRGADNGFIVTSADDLLPALLGFSDNGTFCYESSSPAFKWWIGQYSQEAEAILSTNQKLEKTSEESVNAELISHDSSMMKTPRTEIVPLLHSEWNQTQPFNNDCPMIGGNRAVTGCVATAMAQVMNYHKYPEIGTGYNSYEWNGQELSYDFGSHAFDWANMLNNYKNGVGTEIEKAAVANLLYACGVSINVQYGLSESGAYDSYVPYALANYFGYDKNVRFTARVFHTNEEWENMIYSELCSNRPVILGGSNDRGMGHEFVCDGFKDELYHINWGWGGLSDGYFLLSDLSPDEQGTGGGTSGYNSEVHLIYNIKKPDGNVASTYPLSTKGGLELTDTKSGNNTIVSFSNEGGVFNASPTEFNVDMMLKFESSTDDIVYSEVRNLNFKGMKGGRMSGYGKFSIVVPSTLSPGEYKATLVYKAPDNGLQDVPFSIYFNSYVNVTVDNNGNFKCTAGDPIEKSFIKVTQLYPTVTVKPNVQTKFFISVLNYGTNPYAAGSLDIRIYDEDSDEAKSRINLSVPTLSPREDPYNFNFTTTLKLPDGDYEMICFDAYGDPISERFPLTIGESGVESLFDVDSQITDIYTSNGILIKKGIDKEYLRSLTPGIYILRNAGNTSKILIP